MFFKQNANRRSFLGALGAAVGALATPFRWAGKSAPFTPPPVNITGFGSTGNVYEVLGVTTVINGEGTMTVLGGSLMRPEVEALMSLAGRHFWRTRRHAIRTGWNSHRAERKVHPTIAGSYWNEVRSDYSEIASQSVRSSQRFDVIT